MLTIIVGAQEVYNDETESFFTSGGVELQLEHSLVSLSKWESVYEKPFLGKQDKTPEEIVEYVKCMTLTPHVPDDVYQKLSEANFEAINKHLNAKMSATWFNEAPGAPKSNEVVTAELIYYWMTVFSIDFQCETWHLNRLFTLIRICNIKQAKPKKMSRAEIAARNRELNSQRKAQTGSRG